MKTGTAPISTSIPAERSDVSNTSDGIRRLRVSSWTYYPKNFDQWPSDHRRR